MNKFTYDQPLGHVKETYVCKRIYVFVDMCIHLYIYCRIFAVCLHLYMLNIEYTYIYIHTKQYVCKKYCTFICTCL